MSDLTIIYLTANQHPEVFTKYQRDVLLKATEGYPLISVSREPIDFGLNILDDGKKSHINMYHQLLRAARLATTPFIAVAEDDVLYSKEHFNFYRPKLDTFAYDMSRWSLYTWNGIYSLKQRISNCTLIAPTKLLISAWEERFNKYPEYTMPDYFVCELGRNLYERQMGVTEHKTFRYYADVPSIHINHPNGTDSTGHRKKLGQIKAYDIPFWGKSKDILKLYV